MPQVTLLSRIILTPRIKCGGDIASKHTVWEVVQIDKETNEVLVEAMNHVNPLHPKRLETAMWVKLPEDPRFLYLKVVL